MIESCAARSGADNARFVELKGLRFGRNSREQRLILKSLDHAFWIVISNILEASCVNKTESRVVGALTLISSIGIGFLRLGHVGLQVVEGVLRITSVAT